MIKDHLHPDGRPYTQEEFIDKIKTDDEFAKKWGELGPIYGKQWRKWKTDKTWKEHTDLGPGYLITTEHPIYIDQIQNLIDELKTNPDSIRLRVSAWNVGELYQIVLPPCPYGFKVYTRELSLGERTNYKKKRDGIARTFASYTHQMLDGSNIPTRAISLMWNQRSVDTFLGLPFNIASYGLLLEIIAKAMNMIPDQLIGNLGDVHLYNNHLEQASEQCNRTPYDLPKLNINTEFWPTEGGSCGEGPLDATAVFNLFQNDNFCKCLLEEDIQLYDYQSHPTIKAILSN